MPCKPEYVLGINVANEGVTNELYMSIQLRSQFNVNKMCVSVYTGVCGCVPKILAQHDVLATLYWKSICLCSYHCRTPTRRYDFALISIL